MDDWFSPAASNTVNTADLVAEAGITYYSDWYHDDQPTPLRVKNGKTKAGRLVSVPYTMDINDFYLTRTQIEGEEFAQMAIESDRAEPRFQLTVWGVGYKFADVAPGGSAG